MKHTILLPNTDVAKRSFRRSALRYAAKVARQLGYDDAATALEYVAEGMMIPPALATFD